MAGEIDLEKLGMTQEEWDALDEGEQTKLLEESSQQTQEPETEKQIKGLLADLKKERDRRSTSEEKVSELEERISEMEALLEKKEAKTSEEEEEEEEGEEGEFVTAGKVKKVVQTVLSKREEEYNKRILALESAILSGRLKTSEDAVKEKYSPEKVGEELCYDKVMDEGFSKLLKENPAYREVVLSSANPAEEAYKIGLTHPDFQSLLKSKATGEAVDKLGRPKPKTKIGSGQGGTGFDASKASIGDLIKLSGEELLKLAKET